MPDYKGSCHCGAVTFSFTGEVISEGLKCNCSYCARRSAMMLPYTLRDDELQRSAAADMLGCYRFGSEVAHHYFCRNCGIYTFHESMRKPGYYRVNLGCIDELDVCALPHTLFNGRELL